MPILGCPDGFLKSNFENHCYFPSFNDGNPAGPKNWTDARAYCMQLSDPLNPEFEYDLVSLQSEEEYNFILGPPDRPGPWSSTVYDDWKSQFNIWIGLNDINVEGQWKWSDGSPVKYANPAAATHLSHSVPPWRDREPLDIGVGIKFCYHLNHVEQKCIFDNLKLLDIFYFIYCYGLRVRTV